MAVACCRRLRKRCKKCLSIRFWTSIVNSKFKAFFGTFVRKSIILLYIVGDIICCSGILLYHFMVPELAPLTLIPFIVNYKAYMTVMGLRILLFLIGMWACCGRKVKTMRVFFFMMPCAILCALISASPLINCHCDCTSWKQCQVAIAWNRRQLVNTVPDEIGSGELFVEPPKPHTGEDDGFYHGKSEKESHHEEHILYNSEETDTGKISQADLLADTCTCSGKVEPSLRKSCRFFRKIDPLDRDEMPRSWCEVREESLDACQEKGIGIITGEDGVEYSEELCQESAACECSTDGMLAKPKGFIQDIKWNLLKNKEELGSTCEFWTKRDPLKWCFVGFDSVCSDRKKYSLNHAELKDVNVDRITQVSQYFSTIPCYKEERHIARRWCRFWRNLLRIVTFLLVFGPWPMGVIIYLWLLNRCGDLFNMKEQFSVSFSSSESDDDFTVRDSVCEDMSTAQYRQTIAQKLQAGLPLDAVDEGSDTMGSKKSERQSRRSDYRESCVEMAEVRRAS